MEQVSHFPLLGKELIRSFCVVGCEFAWQSNCCFLGAPVFEFEADTLWALKFQCFSFKQQ